MYFNEKYQFEYKWNAYSRNFRSNLEIGGKKLFCLNDSSSKGLIKFIGSKNYLSLIMGGYDTSKNAPKVRFLSPFIEMRDRYLINNIELDQTLTFAKVEISEFLECTSGKGRSSIFLEKIKGKWTIIYPTQNEPRIQYNKLSFPSKYSKWRYKQRYGNFNKN